MCHRLVDITPRSVGRKSRLCVIDYRYSRYGSGSYPMQLRNTFRLTIVQPSSFPTALCREWIAKQIAFPFVIHPLSLPLPLSLPIRFLLPHLSATLCEYCRHHFRILSLSLFVILSLSLPLSFRYHNRFTIDFIFAFYYDSFCYYFRFLFRLLSEYYRTYFPTL